MLEGGFFLMMVVHFPSSVALPVLGETVFPFLDGMIRLFTSTDIMLAPFLILFAAGITQYFIIGYLLGWTILFFRKKFGKQEVEKKSEVRKEITAAGKIKKAKIVFINFGYLIFTFPIFLIIYEYLHDIFTDFVRFKMMHATSNIAIDLIVIFLWGVSSFYVYKFNKKVFNQDKWNLVYMGMPLLVILTTLIFIN
jgi:hypothetical protein